VKHVEVFVNADVVVCVVWSHDHSTQLSRYLSVRQVDC